MKTRIFLNSQSLCSLFSKTVFLSAAVIFLFAAIAPLLASDDEAGDAAGESQAGNLNRTYTYIDLGVFGDGGGNGELSAAYAINLRGRVVGVSSTNAQFVFHAFSWKDGQLADLAVIGGEPFGASGACGINNKGEIVGGTTVTSSERHTLLCTVTECLPTWAPITGPGSSSVGLDINQAGQIVGNHTRTQSSSTRAFLYENGRIRDLGTLGGRDTSPFGTEAEANAINDLGQIVGSSVPTQGIPLHAFVWENGVMRDLGTLGGNNEATQAFAINNAGHIVWTSPPAGDFPHAVLWRNGKIIDLGVLGTGILTSAASGINRFDQIVGTSDISPPRFENIDHAFLWEKGRMSDLNDRVTNLPLDVTLEIANAINDRGEIVGRAQTYDRVRFGIIDHGFLLVPNP